MAPSPSVLLPAPQPGCGAVQRFNVSHLGDPEPELFLTTKPVLQNATCIPAAVFSILSWQST
jgi:hypothetical protein